MRTLRNLIVLIIATSASLNWAWAGPPFITDDPEPVEYQHWEINYAVSGTWRQGETSSGIPSIDINYGVSPNIQLHAQPRYSYEKAGKDANFGIDDTEVGIKYRFLNIEHNNLTFMLGIYPMLQTPTGDTKLGSDRGKWQSFLPLWIQLNTEKWTFYGGAGYRLNPGIGNKNSLFFGGTGLYQATPSLKLGGEVFHETADVVQGKGSTGFNVGGIFNLIKDNNLLFSVGKSLSNVSLTNQVSAYIAMQVLY